MTAINIYKRSNQGSIGLHMKTKTVNTKVFKKPEAANMSFATKKSMSELENNDCRWPIGDPKSKDFAFCGAKVSGGSYCAGHAKIAYVKTIKRS